MKKNPRHRSPRGVLARLARESVYWHAGPARDDVIGMLPLANVGFHVTRLLTRRFGMDRATAEIECARDAGALLGFEPNALKRGEHGAWTSWAPLILALPGVSAWSAVEKRALVDVVRAKGGQRESEFVRRFDAHARLRAAIRALAEDDASG